MKRTLVACVMLISCVCMLFATAQKEVQVQDNAGSKPLTIMINDAAGSLDGMQAMIDAFQKKTGITCEVEIIPSGDSGEQFTLVRLATGAMADIFMSNAGSKLVELVPADNLYNLKGQPFIDNINDEFIKSVTVGDGIYGVPSIPSGSVGGVFYNKVVYKDLGLEIPKTWDEFLNNCEIIKTKSDVIPVSNPNAKTSGKQLPFLTNYYYVQQHNPNFAQEYTERKIDLHDDPYFVRGLSKLYDIKVKGYLDPDAEVAMNEDSAKALGEGRAAHVINYTNILRYVTQLTPEHEEDVGFFPLPDIDPEIRGVGVWMPQAFVMNKYPKAEKEALEFMAFIATPEAVEAYGAVQDFTGGILIKGASLPDNVSSALKESQYWVENASSPVMEYQCDIKGSNQATICAMVASGMTTPEAAILEMEKDNAIDARDKGIPGW